MVSKISFKASAVRTISSPSQEGVTTYFAYVNFRDLPDNLPLEVNPRKPKMGTAVAKALINAVKSADTDFDINNRGIVIVAKDFKFNTNDQLVTIDLDDNPQNFGILDGGHTYTAIKDHKDELSDEIDKFVRLEIIVGNELTVSRIADARNTSASVSDIALYELDDRFDFIKEAIKNEPYANEVAIKDNAPERLQIIELLKLLYAYNIYKFQSGNETPTSAYSSKAAVFKDIKADLDQKTHYYEKLSKVLPDLVKLYDHIEADFKSKYNESNPGGRFGRNRGIETRKDGKKPFTTLFLANDTDYKIAVGYILPVFGAFRVLLDPEKLDWIIDPFEMWNIVGADLVKNTLDSSRNNPQDAGKNSTIWSNNYAKVENEMFRKLLQQNRS